MNNYYRLNLLASTYGSGTFNSGNYNNSAATSTGTGSGSGSGSGSSAGSSSGGSLSNTGIAIAGIVTVAALILLAAMAVRIWRRPAKQAVETVESDDTTQ